MPLDPACALFIRNAANDAPLPEALADRLGEMRARAEAMGRLGFPAESLHAVRDVETPEVRLRTFLPVADQALPILVWVHGGSWTRGSLNSHDSFFRTVANRANMIVVAVDYTLAPEARFPRAIEQVVHAVAWSIEHAAEIGGDGSSVSLGGDSSGANIAAAAASLIARRGSMIERQVLLVPLLDTRFRSASWDARGADNLLSRAQLEWALALYAPDVDRNDPLLSPLAADDLRDLPPAVIVTGEYDPLRDDGADYARRLIAAGISVSYTEWPGMIHHATLATQAMPIGAAAVLRMADTLRRFA